MSFSAIKFRGEFCMDIEARFEDLENKLRRQDGKLLFHKRLWMGVACLLAGVTLPLQTGPC